MDRVKAFEQMKVDMGVSPILPPDQSMATSSSNIYNSAAISPANISGPPKVSLTDNINLSEDLREPMRVKLEAPKAGGGVLGEFLGGCAKIVQEYGDRLTPANSPEEPLMRSAPAPQMASIPSSGPSFG